MNYSVMILVSYAIVESLQLLIKNDTIINRASLLKAQNHKNYLTYNLIILSASIRMKLFCYCQQLLQVVVMSNNHRCNMCKKGAVEPLNLRCQHHPCYQCAQKIMVADPNSKIQLKYQIVCPSCSKKTVFYDLRHLILTPQQNLQDEELFVTDKFITIKSNPKVLREQALSERGQNSQHLTRRGSIQSIANNNKMLVEVRCTDHNQLYKYFCADCCEKGNRCLVCGECAKPHYSGGHRLLTIKQGQSRLLGYNMRNKEEMLVKAGQINFMMQTLGNNKQVVSDKYRKLQQTLTFQFEKVIQALNQNYQQAKATLHQNLAQSLRQIDERFQKLQSHQGILQSLKQIELKDIETSMKFYQTYEKYTITNQLSQIKVDIESIRFPALIPRVEQLASLAATWIEVAFAENQTKVKTRKNSALEEPLTQRSAREKQNRKIALYQTNLNLKKIPN